MERRGLLRSTVPLILLIAFAVVSPSLQTSSLGLRFREERVGDYSFEDLSHLLPEGVVTISAAASLGRGAVIAGRTNTDMSVILRYEPGQEGIAERFDYLPPHYFSISSIAAKGASFMVHGRSVGSATVMGLYNASSSSFIDHTQAIPPDVRGIQLVEPMAGSFFVVLENETQLIPASFSPSEGLLNALEIESFTNLTAVRDAAWNGTHLYVAGVWAGGSPALFAINPSNGSLEDFSSLLPGDIQRIDHLVWTDGLLYILGLRYWFWTTRASIAVFDPVNRTVESLTSPSWNDYTSVQSALWNGTALLLLMRQGGWHVVGAYYPASDTVFFAEDLIPGFWSYVAMLLSDRSLLFIGNYYGPVVGFVDLNSWTWQERERVFEGAYEAIVSASATDESFVLVGRRSGSGALGFLDPSSRVLEDRSDDIDADSVILIGAAWDGQRLLLTGANESSGVLYAYDPSTGALDNHTSVLPGDLQALFLPAWNGSIYAIPGFGNGLAFLMLFAPATGTLTDLSSSARLYFLLITAVVPYDGLFLLVGYNNNGPALGTLDPATGTITYLGTELGELYGPDALLVTAAWNGEAFLLVGFRDDKPLMGLYSPSSETYDDLSGQLPEGFGGILRAVWNGEGFIVGGYSASLGVYFPTNDTFVDLSDALPPSYESVDFLAALDSDVLIISREASGRPLVGILSVERGAPGPLDTLPSFLRDPNQVAILGLSIALASILAFLAGRRGKKPQAMPPPPQTYPPGPQEVPSEVYQGDEQYRYGP